MNPEIYKSLKHNLIVNLLDGAFFGFAFGFASFVTVIPLYVRTLTDSAILIGLIPAIHATGWQLPQLFIAKRVAHQKRYKPMMLVLTTQERLPFLGLAIVAWFTPSLGARTALIITFALLIWQGLGGGFTATAWTSLIAKIFPSDRRGTFLGAQSSAANALASVGAIFAGIILEKIVGSSGFALCFLLAFLVIIISFYFLAQTREPESEPIDVADESTSYWAYLRAILKRDRNFCWFLIARITTIFALMGVAFYTVYAVGQKGVTDLGIGIMTSILLVTQILANPIMGWLGDHWNRRGIMEIGMLAATASGLLAWKAVNPNWFYLVFILTGIANVAAWTIGMAMILEFGYESERPAYIGLANTLVAPASILAPFLGGWLAQVYGYPAAFLASAIAGIATLLIFHFLVNNPKQVVPSINGQSEFNPPIS